MEKELEMEKKKQNDLKSLDINHFWCILGVQAKLQRIVEKGSILTGIKSICLVAILCLCLSSCEKPIDKDFGNTPPLKIVAEAMITNRDGESYVKLSLPMASPNDTPIGISGAFVVVSDGVNTEIISEDSTHSGIYRPEPGIKGVSGKFYMIYIQVGEYIDSAFTYLIPVTPLNEFATRADDSKPGYFFISGENSSDPAMIRYFVTPTGCSGDDFCAMQFDEYILSSFDIPQIFSPKRESLSFPAGSKVIRKKYSLNPDYEAYIRAILSETEWRGGLFDVQPGNPKGNFGENTLGFFAGCSLVIDTVVIN